MKSLIAKKIKKVLEKNKIKLSEEEILKYIEIPPNAELGDYAFPCFFLAEKMKQDPKEIATDLRKNIDETGFEEVRATGAYINFFIDRKKFSSEILERIIIEKKEYGSSNSGNEKNTMVEFPSPNTNKPLHLGHLRNMSIGESISRILEFCGNRVIRANLNNDRGIHICKSMLAYKKYGKGKTPENKKIKSDHFVGDFYVLFNKRIKQNPKLEEEVQEMLRKWEAGDKETIALWKKMNKWALDGFKQTYKKFGIRFDKEYYESEIYTLGKEIVLDGLKKNIFKKDNAGNIVVDLGKNNEKVLLRADGTSVYITQDLYLAILKLKEFNLAKSIYVVGNEQNYHFDVLFEILERLGYSKEQFKHLSYGMVNLPEGKMKSREGTVVDADDLIEKVQELTKKEIKQREPKIKKEELEKRSLAIALGAIKYLLLKIDAGKNTIFNPKEAINFEGDTGAYVLYTYARASSILKKVKNINENFEINSLENSEFELIKKLSQFPEIVESSSRTLNPSGIANYSYQICKNFNEFYHSSQVIGSEEETFRLMIVSAFRQVLKNSLNLLGIETIERM